MVSKADNCSKPVEVGTGCTICHGNANGRRSYSIARSSRSKHGQCQCQYIYERIHDFKSQRYLSVRVIAILAVLQNRLKQRTFLSVCQQKPVYEPLDQT